MVKVRSFIIIACVLISIQVVAQNRNEIFVSPAGNDSNVGSLNKPLKTIVKAKDKARQLINISEDNVTVYLRGGMYPIEETIEFDHRDANQGNLRTVYSAYKDEKPIISGGVKVTGWQKASNGLWKVSVKDLDFRQLYINGNRAVRARTPNKGSYNQNLMWDIKEQEILIDSKHFKQWDNLKDVELIVNMNWGEAILRMESFTVSSDEPYTWQSPSHARITVQEPERHLVFARHFPPKRNELAWYTENAMEFLDSPGEWYYNKAEEILYYYPLTGEDMASVDAIIPVVETLVSIKGSLDKPVINLDFKGITFSHSTWLRPSQQGALNLQACNYTIDPTAQNIQYVERCKSSVLVEAAHNCHFENNTFTHLGAVGLDLHFGTKNCLINANVFKDISANGIQVGKFSDPEVEVHIPYNPADESEICTGDIISNNKISKIGQDYTGAVGIACGYPRQVQIIHNEIYELPYSGISVGWGWTSEENAMRENIIANNNVHHVCQIMCDCGGIYTLSAQPGTEIKENYIHHVEHAPWAGNTHNTGIYLDEGSKGILIENNVISNIDDYLPFVLKGESVFKNNNGNNAEVIKKAGVTYK